MEMMFGSGSPMWTAIPSIGMTYQPLGLGNRSIGAPAFGGQATPGGLGGGLVGGQAFSTQAGLQTPGIATTYPFAPNGSAGLIGVDAPGFITASALLTAVAMRRGQ